MLWSYQEIGKARIVKFLPLPFPSLLSLCSTAVCIRRLGLIHIAELKSWYFPQSVATMGLKNRHQRSHSPPPPPLSHGKRTGERREPIPQQLCFPSWVSCLWKKPASVAALGGEGEGSRGPGQRLEQHFKLIAHRCRNTSKLSL